MLAAYRRPQTAVGRLWYAPRMFGFKTTVRAILNDLLVEIERARSENDLVTAKVLHVVFTIVQRHLG